MKDSKIEWTDSTWNPLRGCSRVSEGCRNCYAERVSARFSGPGQPYEGLATMKGGKAQWTGKVMLAENHLEDPMRWKKPRRIFVNSMSDLFHESVPDNDIRLIFAVMMASPQHTFQVLTKRAHRMAEFFQRNSANDCFVTGVQENELRRANNPSRLAVSLRILDHVGKLPSEWSLPNVWLGVSVEDQGEADSRIPKLLETPAAVRFLSCEPLLGAIDLRRYLTKLSIPVPAWSGDGVTETHPIDWVIVGGESGHGARPMHPAWARSLRDQCAAAGVAFFMKQWGEWIPTSQCGNGDGPGCSDYYDAKGAQTQVLQLDGRIENAYPPGAMLMFKAGKKAAGRLLDGKEHNGMPEAGK